MRKDENSVKKAPQEARDDVMSTKCRTAHGTFTFYRQSWGRAILENCTSLVCEPTLSASAPWPSSSCHAQLWPCTTSAVAACPAGWTAAWSASTCKTEQPQKDSTAYMRTCIQCVGTCQYINVTIRITGPVKEPFLLTAFLCPIMSHFITVFYHLLFL